MPDTVPDQINVTIQDVPQADLSPAAARRRFRMEAPGQVLGDSPNHHSSRPTSAMSIASTR
ncbi:hypothetical protein GCM10009735_83350 [Actinomadura chokoriensis]